MHSRIVFLLVTVGLATTAFLALSASTKFQGAIPFKIITLTGGRNNKFCGADPSTKKVACDRSSVTDHERFRVEKMTANRFALKNEGTQKYCHDLGDRIQCHSDQPGEHEMYEIQEVGDRGLAFLGPKSGTKRLWCSDEGNRIICNRPKIGAWETFSWTEFVQESPPPPPPSTPGTTAAAASQQVKPSSATMPSPATPNPAEDLDKTFFNQTVVLTGPAADHTRYCGVKSTADPSIECEDTEVFDNHQFEIRKTGECKPRPEGGFECQFAFKNKLTGKYCADEGNRIVCNRDAVGDWERYAFIKHPEGRDFSFPGAKSGAARKACSDKASNIMCNGGKDDYRSLNTRFRWKLLSEISGVKKGDNGPAPEGADADTAAAETTASGESSTQEMETAVPMDPSVMTPVAIAGAVLVGILLLRTIASPRAAV